VGAHQFRQVGFSLTHKTVAVSVTEVDWVQSVVKISQHRRLFYDTNCNTYVTVVATKIFHSSHYLT